MVYVVNEEFSSLDLGDEMVLTSPNADLITLNYTAKKIYLCIQCSKSYEQIIQIMLREYPENDATIIQNDIEECIQEMLTTGIIYLS